MELTGGNLHIPKLRASGVTMVKLGGVSRLEGGSARKGWASQSREMTEL